MHYEVAAMLDTAGTDAFAIAKTCGLSPLTLF